MSADLLELYDRASAWTAEKVAGAPDLDAPTPCDGWRLRDLLNHMIETQRYFTSSARGREASPPSPEPPDVIGEDPAPVFARSRAELLEAFGQQGAGPLLGIALADQLLHGWDVAQASGQDATMPEGLPDAAYDAIHGRFTEEQRQGVFKPELPVPEGATAQERLLAYTGRAPGSGA